MNKKFVKILIVVIFVICILISIGKVNLESWNVKFGLLQYDGDHVVTGCSGEGNECVIIY